jgi:hypothetical protein
MRPYPPAESEQTFYYKLRCNIRGEDPIFDDALFTMPNIYEFSNHNYPTSAYWQHDVDRSYLNEDWGTDEVYAKIILMNLTQHFTNVRKTNVIKREF